MNGNRRTLNRTVGITTLGGSITGIASLLGAFAAFVDGDTIAVGVCLVAAALAFGLLAQAVLGK